VSACTTVKRIHHGERMRDRERLHHGERMHDRQRSPTVSACVTANVCTTVEERPFQGRVKLPTLCTGFSR